MLDKQKARRYFSEYLKGIRKTLMDIHFKDFERILQIIIETSYKKRTVFVMGNGGSASTASHFVCDLTKGTFISGKPAARAIALNENIALFTAIANDISYEKIFEEQLKLYLEPGDTVILISASGNSPNILRAAKYAKSRNAKVIGILGFGGGKLKNLCDASIVLSPKHYGYVEGIHSIVAHLITNYLCEIQKSSRDG